jgi:hypothetical protein
MRVVSKISLATALMAGCLSLSSIAQAHDWDRDHDRWRWEHERHYVHHERPIVVRERPVIVERERPVFVAPPVMYAPQQPSGLNLNFNIPLQ